MLAVWIVVERGHFGRRQYLAATRWPTHPSAIFWVADIRELVLIPEHPGRGVRRVLKPDHVLVVRELGRPR